MDPESKPPTHHILKERWKNIQPTENDKAAYHYPENCPLTPRSTIKDAIIHWTALRPAYINTSKGKDALQIRFPYILEELARLASKEAEQLLHESSTQELRQAITQVIELFGSHPWKWYDQFEPEDLGTDQPKEGEEEDLEDKEEMDGLLADIMNLGKVKEITEAGPAVDLQVQEIFNAAIKVIGFDVFTNIG